VEDHNNSKIKFHNGYQHWFPFLLTNTVKFTGKFRSIRYH